MKSGLLIVALFLSAAFVNAQDQKAAPSAPAPMTTAAPAAVENKNAPEMTFEADEYSFGTVKQGEKVTHIFTFTNTGKEPLIITNAAGSCHCTVPEWPKEPVLKGQKGTIKVVFDSSGKMGMQDKTVTIQSNAKTNPKIIHVKGTVEVPAQAEQAAPVKKDNQAAPLENKSK
jgi:hypothetical protein